MNKNSHIIFSYAFDSAGKAQKLDNSETGKELKNEGLAWVHLDANNNQTKWWLEKEVSYLDHLIIDALLAEETRPRIVEFETGLLIILRAVNLNKNAQPEDMVSVRIWVDSYRIITIQLREMKALFNIPDHLDQGRTINSSGEFLYNLIYEIIDGTSVFLEDLSIKVDALEEKITTTHDMHFREQVIQIRSQSAIFKRHLLPQKDVIKKLMTTENICINDWAKRHFQENHDNITRLIEEAEEARDRSQILHDELSNSLSEKLNKSMYKLSVIASIFMPLTFLTGVFGMNIGGVPGVGYEGAFNNFVFGVLLIAIVQIIFFKSRKWL